MTEKVKIPQSVADAYTDLEASWSLTDIFKMVTADFTVSDSRVQTLVEWNESGRCDEGAGLMQLLLGQYKVEPETLKIGDWAIFEHGGDTWIAKVKGIRPERLGKKLYLPDNEIHHLEGDRYYANVKKTDDTDLIKAEKERRKWVAIGREVGEFRSGDVYVDSSSDLYLLTEGATSLTDSTTLEIAQGWYANGDFRGFFPVESFISFEDGDEG